MKWFFECIFNLNVFFKFRILDLIFYFLKVNRDVYGEFIQKYIFGVQFFSIIDCCDYFLEYEYMLFKLQDFVKYVGDLGINNDIYVIVYDVLDGYGFFFVQRVWWMFYVFGYEQVLVLNGGFKKWCEDGYVISDIIEKVKKDIFIFKFREELVKSFEDIERNLNEKFF